MLNVELGIALMLGYARVRALARGLSCTRVIRFGWAQVGDQPE